MYLANEIRKALGTSVQLTIVADQEPQIVDGWLRQLWLELLLFEKRCSRFLPNSELSQFNRAAGMQQRISPELRDVLLAAQRMGKLTDGLFNPFVLPALQRAGYVHSLVEGYEADPVDDHSARQVVPVERLQVGDDWASIPYGTALDLGGCGKGYIGDVLAAMMRNREIQGFWFSVGGDVVTYGSDAGGEPWTVSVVESIQRPGRVLARVAMPDAGPYAVATSTTRLRKGERQGKAWHHIIDPRTGTPAETDLSLASVWSSSLLEADVLASCLIIEGLSAAGQYSGRFGSVRSVLVQNNEDSCKTYGPGISIVKRHA